ncbi:MAG: hypothetical protein J6I58_05820 [Eubacterium sp.]|nr:hypothetical protein [Eubacterium sp.]MBR1772978.1 hypothetical protein [Eubacterium sp.]
MADLDEELRQLEQDTDEYYGIEQERPAKKIFPKEQEKTRSLRLKRYKEQNLARFSNIYMLAGMLIGVAVFYFLVVPEIKSSYKEEIRDLETSYNQTLSTKNSEIDNLKLELDSVNSKNSDLEATQTTMQTTIDKLTEEVETLKRTVESGGLSTTTSNGTVGESEAVMTTPEDEGVGAEDAALAAQNAANAAAERNNASVIGISTDSVEGVIDHE